MPSHSPSTPYSMPSPTTPTHLTSPEKPKETILQAMFRERDLRFPNANEEYAAMKAQVFEECQRIWDAEQQQKYTSRNKRANASNEFQPHQRQQQPEKKQVTPPRETTRVFARRGGISPKLRRPSSIGEMSPGFHGISSAPGSPAQNKFATGIAPLQMMETGKSFRAEVANMLPSGSPTFGRTLPPSPLSVEFNFPDGNKGVELSQKRKARPDTRQDMLTDDTSQQKTTSDVEIAPAAVTLDTYVAPQWLEEFRGVKRTRRGGRLQNELDHSRKTLSSLKEFIGVCERSTNPGERDRVYGILTELVHKAEFIPINEVMLVQTFILGDTGLCRIFKAPMCHFPWYLQADAFQLCLRWSLRIFDTDLLRGINRPNASATSYKLNRDWKKEHPTNARVFGDNTLVNGQWWPNQLCLVRDGAHGSAQGGIYGAKDKGAYSIVVSGKYKDNDQGYELFYMGTDGKDEIASENTNRLVESVRFKNPVRVIRSSKLGPENPYRPTHGYRYDGLYDVVGYQIVNPSNAVHRFHLVRRVGQDPLRYGDGMTNPVSRPTKREIAEYEKLKMNN
ncbi:hypothetical protein BU24DRAFT_449484 [Aaosphaeria arxii CBS 175.79]|uniref:YDG domain-containing protein n=1 Tax=Aaosphaeria arxii CBS 175.79 TaxID=1450172 RepID=A0A6A5Y028_9PLEO|nr:uncharacterized protein BU24DRAFT_449484 [Aaosphaeria arxii CBS 175.79]KAF2017914.1 hypothetical protein BU24DRAFT_449484 [Aaosphaeria arxii CBS 175.79]